VFAPRTVDGVGGFCDWARSAGQFGQRGGGFCCDGQRASFKAMLLLLAHMHESEKDEVRFRLDVYVPLNTQLFTKFWDQHVTGQQKAVLLRAARDQQSRSPVAKRKM